MKSWIEGQQSVGFPSSWYGIKLDEHRYYKRISGHGIKCVDYLIIDPDWGLYLIELKDYPKGVKVPLPKQHHTTLLAKREGSIKLIKAVNKAFRRQWYFRMVFLKLKLYSLCPSEWLIWHHAEECLIENRITVIGDFCIRK